VAGLVESRRRFFYNASVISEQARRFRDAWWIWTDDAFFWEPGLFEKDLLGRPQWNCSVYVCAWRWDRRRPSRPSGRQLMSRQRPPTTTRRSGRSCRFRPAGTRRADWPVL